MAFTLHARAGAAALLIAAGLLTLNVPGCTASAQTSTGGSAPSPAPVR